MKFSIAIPAYENEKALERALNSIAKQSYKNIEIIVSDDCSKKSNLKKICEDFKKKKFRIIVTLLLSGKKFITHVKFKIYFSKSKRRFYIISTS